VIFDPPQRITFSTCIACDKITKHVVHLIIPDGDLSSDHVYRFMCESCTDIATDELAALRRQFDMLMQNGVSRERANELMIEKIHREMKAS